MRMEPPAGSQYPPYPQSGGHPAAGYGPGYGAPPARRNGLGTAALVLGVLAIVTSWTIIGGIVLGVLALIFGLVGRGRANRYQANDGGVANAGWITGLIGIVLALGALTVGLVFGISILNSPAGRTLTDCLSHAQNAQQRQQCNIDFQRNVLPSQ